MRCNYCRCQRFESHRQVNRIEFICAIHRSLNFHTHEICRWSILALCWEFISENEKSILPRKRAVEDPEYLTRLRMYKSKSRASRANCWLHYFRTTTAARYRIRHRGCFPWYNPHPLPLQLHWLWWLIIIRNLALAVVKTQQLTRQPSFSYYFISVWRWFWRPRHIILKHTFETVHHVHNCSSLHLEAGLL